MSENNGGFTLHIPLGSDPSFTEQMKEIASVQTLRRLLDVWPEIESFTHGLFDQAAKPVTALALPIKNLNLSLGLPPNAEAA